MRSKIKLNEQSGRTVAEVFDDFVFAQTAEGLSAIFKIKMDIEF